jgi:hypothetical protein
VCCNHGHETAEEEGCGEQAVPTTGTAKDQQECDQNGDKELQHAGGADEEYARLVAVADGPADEVGVGLPAEGGFGDLDGGQKGRGMRGVLQRTHHQGAIAVGKVEFTRGASGEVMLRDVIALFAIGLDGDCWSG